MTSKLGEIIVKVYVFPGQGSQSKGMGGSLFDKYQNYTDVASDILGYSIKSLCLEDPLNQLSKTEFTQPALYVVNVLTYLDKQAADPTPANYLAGHSLGEYNALFAAGAFSFEVGLQIVKKRGELMSRAPAGSMAAVIGIDAMKISQAIADSSIFQLDIANLNSPTQTIVSGTVSAIDQAQPIFEKLGAMVVPLAVNGAFHSRLMQPVVNEFEAFLNQFEYYSLRTKVISNISAKPYIDNQIIYNLKEQLCNPVQWLNSVRYLMAQGELEFDELGPGDVLTKLIKSIVKTYAPMDVV